MKKMIAIALLIASPALAEEIKPVKLSVNGICHDQSSAHYNRTRNFTAFETLEQCLAAGGRLPQ